MFYEEYKFAISVYLTRIQETKSISQACMCRMHFNSVLKWRLEMHALTHVWEFLDLWLLMSSVDFKKAKYFVYRMTSSFYRVFQVFTSLHHNVDCDEKCRCLNFANVRNHVFITFNALQLICFRAVRTVKALKKFPTRHRFT